MTHGALAEAYNAAAASDTALVSASQRFLGDNFRPGALRRVRHPRRLEAMRAIGQAPFFIRMTLLAAAQSLRSRWFDV